MFNEGSEKHYSHYACHYFFSIVFSHFGIINSSCEGDFFSKTTTDFFSFLFYFFFCSYYSTAPEGAVEGD